ncbi:hypothetical protein PHYC_00218 [Phycisphaerales bacterium]|nr:hypothetical protein PHYC_00218 [Phycisphaerales bacterium]
MKTGRPRLPLLIGFLVSTLSLLVACSSTPKGGSKDDYMALFNQGQFAAAYETASGVAGSVRGSHRDRAALIAGLSAYRLGKAGDAHRWLLPLVDNPDPGIAGRANATLGSLAAAQGTHGSAAEYFMKAAGKLTGDDAARALMYAGDAKKAQGKTEEATALYQRAREKVETDVQLRVAIGDRLAGHTPSGSHSGVYTVQAGAFATRRTAETLAGSLKARGETRIVTTRDRAGKTLYAVRVGFYGAKATADSVAKAIGKGAFVTTTDGE